MSQGLRFIRQNLRRLRRRYGLPLSVCNTTTSTVNRDTGARTRVYESVDIQRALVLVGMGKTETKYDVGYLLKQGGEYDIVDRTFILNPTDLGDFIITTDSYIVYDNEKYQVIDVSKYEQNMAIIVPCRRTIGDPFVQIWTRNVHQHVGLTQETINGS